MKRIFAASLVLLSYYCSAQSINTKKVFEDAEKQMQLMKSHAVEFDTITVFPRTIENGRLKFVASRDWTSGFYPGILWYLYNYTHNNKWKKAAQYPTHDLEQEKTNRGTHDMGFKIYCSFGNGYKFTKDDHYKEVIIQSARTLITRFNAKAGVIRSWDHHKEVWDYPVIIDNMMNLELLFAAT